MLDWLHNLGLPLGRKTFPHGIHPDDAKEATSGLPIRRFPFAPYLVLLLSQHAGKPARAVVRAKQEVMRGQPLAEADGFVSAPIHAPASGVVHLVGQAMDASGKMTPAIVLQPFPGSDQQTRWGRPVNPETLSPKEIIQTIQQMGMVGLGGAAFPAHVKFTPPEGKTIHTLIVNGCECEPFLTADHRVMLEYPQEILLGTRLVQKALGAGRSVIAIEDNKPDAAATLREAAREYPEITVEVLPTKYPQGAEKMLTKALLNLEIPTGGLPADVGVMVSNVTTLAEIGTLLPRGWGLTERVITITGQGVERPGNYLMPIGTPLDFILEEVGMRGEAREVIFGGPMMGKGVAYLETPITKGVSGILVASAKQRAAANGHMPCIRCGKCLAACPMHLNPATLGHMARKNQFDAMAEVFNLFDCFECGCCSYTCPAHIPLVQQFRIAKEVVRTRRAAA